MDEYVKLIIKAGPEMDKAFEVIKKTTVIGRDPKNDIVIDDVKVSRKHLIIKKVKGTFIAEDQGSTNGSFLNGKKIKKSVELANGDLITLAENQILEFSIEKDKVESVEPEELKKDTPVEKKPEEDLPIQEKGDEKPAKKALFGWKNRKKKKGKPTEKKPLLQRKPKRKKDKSAKKKSILEGKPTWLVILLAALAFIVVFCVIPFIVVEVTNQWCNLFAGFFNSMSPGVCP